MSQNLINISSLSQLHQILGFSKPSHPLISLIDMSKVQINQGKIDTKVITDFYTISLKDGSCGMDYGRNTFDFEEGVMVFSAPGQVYTSKEVVELGDIKGWMLYFHPDLISNTNLGSQIDDYNFFNYEVFEALHLSETEQNSVNSIVTNIQQEYEQRIDNHSNRVLVSNLELLLNYCLRYYERQFNTRVHQSKDIVAEFEKSIKQYFKDKKQIEGGIPSIQYFADKANLSKHYFSDLIKKETSRTPKDHINDFVINKAKNILLTSGNSISEIAYELGFNYPHYFTRLFKSKTGLSPVEYRNSN